MTEAANAAQPAAVGAEVAAKTAPDAILKDVLGKGWRSVGQRAALGAAGSGLGAGAAWVAGEDPKVGAGIGATAGFMPQGALQFARNQAASPVVQHGANSLIQNLLEQGAGAAGKAAQAATGAFSQDEDDAIQAFLSSP